MKLAIFGLLALASVLFLAVIAFAALGSPYWAIGCGCAIPLCLMIAARESDALREREEWLDSTRHPRL